ncbi:unnamed protein product [Durusdinium trenchii]|uniref:Sugar phosphate transporter domain-containing protein n=1 Tax=Durusdinium trenchii TaxID=1381693 RepID=A0ABP0QT65_9DINO
MMSILQPSQECGFSFRLDLSQRLSRLSRCQGGVAERGRLRGLVQPTERVLVLGSGIGLSSCIVGAGALEVWGLEKDEVKHGFAEANIIENELEGKVRSIARDPLDVNDLGGFHRICAFLKFQPEFHREPLAVLDAFRALSGRPMQLTWRGRVPRKSIARDSYRALDKPRDVTRKVIIFALHSVCSISLTLLNKQLAKEIPFPLSIVFFQCVASIGFTMIANVWLAQIKKIQLSHLPGAMLISVLFLSCLTSSLLGLKHVHVPMVVVGKNLGPFCTALLEAVLLKATLNPRTLFSLLLGVIGSTLYAMGDLNSLFQGLFLVGGNALLVALTSVSEKYVVRTVDQVPFVLETVHRMQMSSAWAPSHTCQLTHRNHIQSSSRAHPF